MENPPGPVIEPVSSTLAGGFLTTGPPRELAFYEERQILYNAGKKKLTNKSENKMENLIQANLRIITWETVSQKILRTVSKR